MLTIDPKLRHDFINNSLRLEVISKLISEDLNLNKTPNLQQINDLEEFLQKEINLIKEIKQQIHTN